MNSRNNPKILLIILGAIVLISIGLIVFINRQEQPAAVLAEGESYEIENIGPGRYKITDDTGKVIDLKRLPSENAVFQDSEGRRYVFVSGSPYKFVKIE